MDGVSMNVQKESRKDKNTVQYATESLEPKGERLVSNRCGSELDPPQAPISSVRGSTASSSCRELFLANIRGLHSTIPEQIITFDEKYVLHCLELIRYCALSAAAWNSVQKVRVLPNDSSNLAESKTRCLYNMAGLAIECPLVSETDVIVESTDEWPIGSITGSQSMINILKSPLLKEFGSNDFDVNFSRTSLVDAGKPVYSDFPGSPRDLSNPLSHKPQKEVPVLDHRNVSALGHKRLVSISSTNSSSSDKSSSSASAASYQGMLQCTWNDGLPHHVFSVDDKNEVYVANLLRVESLESKVLDYVYTFHSSKKGKKDCDIQELELELVGKMRVSTSITLCSNNSEVRETQFVLSVSSDDPTGELQVSTHVQRKNKRLTSKVVNALLPSHSYKRRSSSKFWGSSAIFEDAPWEPSADMRNSVDWVKARAENIYFLNLELAAIIVKDICKNREEADVGGWGLKFLRKSGNDASLETSVPSKCSRDDGECATSIDVLIPAGLHGGPRTRIGGPSSLTERWISGGRCDCGGWDIGCPITVLNIRSSSADSSSEMADSGECKSTDLFIQGSKQEVPALKMVNIHEGLYYIHFQSTLSTLQSFAITAAIIHSRSPLLRSKVYRSDGAENPFK
ncbi:uncharacterized protein LOC105171736 isoform X1 [Sesamum indicum]|uniref:Uncharacterized protein LOC105171736 isoform X1 n=1 Tax=Sesamum indicum TaxID=4182 RepID=A0A6I9TVV7_SESIN|nr:uncharacterized protein LOC105171736 isoform X1 [Sesamum indicum]XP_011091241.1 uncharacterized protein LOC105171736 isoform X1 [Sesamum indicum]XP_011091243.1 uncharacterized protein LOC105171736 isoform X1 [Sesamum indicum]XP_011091244.1 uncharacterized protein LOC105171736 isoform X1 [Sesamum indicum]XP_020552737.1 uncharacterized protein LOC105171736 isoform X1 [Sesamum indicum]